jgi:thiamine pyrophosphokinase
MPNIGSPSARQVFIFLNGPFQKPSDLPSRPPQDALVIAVDGGALHCLALDWPAQILLGDFDSLEPSALALMRDRNPGLDVRTYPKHKDETDFELALALLEPASPSGPDCQRVTILGGLGGRWDMTLANLLSPLAANLGLLHRPPPKPDVVFRDGEWDLHLMAGPAELDLGEAPLTRRVSLLPLLGEVAGASLFGLFKYPLESGVLRPGYTRGLSNELEPGGGRLAVRSGALLVSVSPLSDEGFPRPQPGF